MAESPGLYTVAVIDPPWTWSARSSRRTGSAIRDASKVAELKELIKDVSPQPEIMVGDAGAVEVSGSGGGVVVVWAAGVRARAAHLPLGEDD